MEGKSVNLIEKRLSAFRAKLQEKGLEAAFISKEENVFYMSGFTGDSTYLIISQKEALLVTDFRYTEQAAIQAPEYEVVEHKGSLLIAINEVLKKQYIEKLGFEEAGLTYEEYSKYKQKLDVKEFLPLEGIVEDLRLVKDETELAIIKEAVRIADETFSHILKFIKPGIAEIELAAELEYQMKKLGAKGPSFETIVASGARASMPHGTASAKKLELGDVITFDYGAYYMQYCSDMTRTVFLGQPKDELKKIYRIVLEAQLKAIEGAKSGLMGKDIDGIARDVIKGYGYDKSFGHGLGHGVGVEIHEEPRFSLTGSRIIENNMVVTVEPGIYIPGLGGVRIEDIIIVNDGLPVILTQSTKELLII